MKHPARLAAEKNHAAILADLRRAEAGTDEAAYVVAEAAYNASVANLCSIEAQHPTARESFLRRNRIRLENMGLMA